jgi:glycosyltransferase involved in cell wall biosynthesis
MSGKADVPLIVLATDSAVPSGVGEHMLTLASAISDSHRVVLAFPATDAAAVFLRRAAARGFAVKAIGSEAAFAQWLKDIAAIVLHVHAGIGWEGHGLANAGWIAGVPVIRSEHLPYMLTNEDQKVEHRLAVGLVDRLVFVSADSARTYSDAGFSDARVATVRNGIDAPRPAKAREATRRMLGIGADDFIAITVARFTPQKNHALLIDAAQRVVPISPHVRFLFVGDGPERSTVEKAVAAKGLAGTVTFLGERDDVPDLLTAADLFVLPSHFEGMPLAVLEAMAIGLPLVATRIGGTCEALGEDYPWLVAPDDSAFLSAAIIEALGTEQRRRDLGQRNRQRFEERFCAERMGRDMAAIYRTVLAERATLV